MRAAGAGRAAGGFEAADAKTRSDNRTRAGAGTHRAAGLSRPLIAGQDHPSGPARRPSDPRAGARSSPPHWRARAPSPYHHHPSLAHRADSDCTECRNGALVPETCTTWAAARNEALKTSSGGRAWIKSNALTIPQLTRWILSNKPVRSRVLLPPPPLRANRQAAGAALEIQGLGTCHVFGPGLLTLRLEGRAWGPAGD